METMTNSLKITFKEKGRIRYGETMLRFRRYLKFTKEEYTRLLDFYKYLYKKRLKFMPILINQ